MNMAFLPGWYTNKSDTPHPLLENKNIFDIVTYSTVLYKPSTKQYTKKKHLPEFLCPVLSSADRAPVVLPVDDHVYYYSSIEPIVRTRQHASSYG